MSSTDALTGAVIVAVVGTVAAYVISLFGRVLNVVFLAARVWRLAARHPRAPLKRFPWGSMLSLVLGGAIFWVSMAIAVVLVAESGLALAKQWSVKMPLVSLDPLGTRWLLVYGLIFVGVVVTFTILSPIAWRQELRERDWKRTIRQGLHRLIAATTVPRLEARPAEGVRGNERSALARFRLARSVEGLRRHDDREGLFLYLRVAPRSSRTEAVFLAAVRAALREAAMIRSPRRGPNP
jgi:hypothetical protein